MTEPATTPTAAAASKSRAAVRRRLLLITGAGLGAALMFLLALVTVFGARLDAPTIALAVAVAVLIYALAQLYAMVAALSRPDQVAQVGQAAGSFTQAELREEKRRLLRAIKELEFDFGMGKLSQLDHDSVIATYRLRAIEVMRALEGGSTLHPELARLLAERDAARPVHEPSSVATAASPVASAASPVATDASPVATAASPVAPPVPGPAASGPFDQTTRICGVCGATNDADARFCKLCGAAMKKPEPAAGRVAQAARSGEIGERAG